MELGQQYVVAPALAAEIAAAEGLQAEQTKSGGSAGTDQAKVNVPSSTYLATFSTHTECAQAAPMRLVWSGNLAHSVIIPIE